MYQQIRRTAVVVFIAALVVLTIAIILSIWGVLTHDAIAKAFQSLAVIIVSGSLISVTALIREGRLATSSQNNQPMANDSLSPGKIFLYVLFLLVLMPIVFTILASFNR